MMRASSNFPPHVEQVAEERSGYLRLEPVKRVAVHVSGERRELGECGLARQSRKPAQPGICRPVVVNAGIEEPPVLSHVSWQHLLDGFRGFR